MTPAEVFFGAPGCSPLNMEQELAPPLRREATEEEVAQFTRQIQEKNAAWLEECRQREARYREMLRRDYRRALVHDGTLDAELRPFMRGEFVLIKRRRNWSMGVSCRGPFVVEEQEG